MIRILKYKENTIRKFRKDLQWDLRASYNSSSCLNEKQVLYLEEKLYNLLLEIEEKTCAHCRYKSKWENDNY